MWTIDLGCGSYCRGDVCVDINFGWRSPIHDSSRFDFVASRKDIVDKVIADLNFPLPFRDSAFAEAYMVHVLEHLYRPFDCLKEIKRILKRGGRLKIVVPDASRSPADWKDGTHLVSFTEPTLRRLVSKLFRVVEVRHVYGIDLYLVAKKEECSNARCRGVKVFVLGLPKSATTIVYAWLCRYLKRMCNDVYCVFEPFNSDVVGAVLSGRAVGHSTVGIVEHDYDRLSPTLLGLVAENARWHLEWKTSASPRLPFLGPYWRNIVTELLLVAEPLLVKDVCLWVRAKHLVELAEVYEKDLVLVFTVPSLDAWKRDYLTHRSSDLFPWHKGGVTLFYRLFTGRYLTWDRIEEELELVYSKYIEIVSRLFQDNVAKLGEGVHVSKLTDRISMVIVRHGGWLSEELLEKLCSVVGSFIR